MKVYIVQLHIHTCRQRNINISVINIIDYCIYINQIDFSQDIKLPCTYSLMLYGFYLCKFILKDLVIYRVLWLLVLLICPHWAPFYLYCIGFTVKCTPARPRKFYSRSMFIFFFIFKYLP